MYLLVLKRMWHQKKPTISTVMLGMNDVSRYLYGKGDVDPQTLKKRKHALNLYYKNCSQIYQRLEGIDSELILITPSIYDQTGDLKSDNNFGVNDALGKCAEFIKETVNGKGMAWLTSMPPCRN